MVPLVRIEERGSGAGFKHLLALDVFLALCQNQLPLVACPERPSTLGFNELKKRTVEIKLRVRNSRSWEKPGPLCQALVQ